MKKLVLLFCLFALFTVGIVVPFPTHAETEMSEEVMEKAGVKVPNSSFEKWSFVKDDLGTYLSPDKWVVLKASNPSINVLRSEKPQLGTYALQASASGQRQSYLEPTILSSNLFEVLGPSKQPNKYVFKFFAKPAKKGYAPQATVALYRGRDTLVSNPLCKIDLTLGASSDWEQYKLVCPTNVSPAIGSNVYMVVTAKSLEAILIDNVSVKGGGN